MNTSFDNTVYKQHLCTVYMFLSYLKNRPNVHQSEKVC